MSARNAVTLVCILLSLGLTACSDTRATYEIKGTAHSLSVLRVQDAFWKKTAKYSVVASRMPDCMRRHAMSEALLDTTIDVYSPGNDAWILKQNASMYVVETRSCEGFAKLDKVPDSGMGALVGTFEMKKDVLVFVAAPKPPSSVEAPVADPEPAAN